MNLRQAYELEKLTGKFFSMDVLLLGNNIWVRSYLPIAAFSFITRYFVTDLLQNVLNLILVPVQFFLIQKAAEHVGRKRFDLRVLGSCWWSVWWRATLYTIALAIIVAIAITLVIVPIFGNLNLDSLTSGEISARDPLNTGRDSIIIIILFYVLGSFLAVGYATLRAFRVSCIKTHQCPKHADITQMLEEEEREECEQDEKEQTQQLVEDQATDNSPPDDVERYAPPPDYELRVPTSEEANHDPVMPKQENAEQEKPLADNIGQDNAPAEKPDRPQWGRTSVAPRRGGWSNPKPGKHK